MMFISIIMFILVGLLFYLHRQADNLKFIKTSLIFLIISIIANISLAQNYTQSMIPGLNDGIGISNRMAYWIITDSGWGKSWSISLFKNAFDISMIVSIVALLILVASIVLESRRKRIY